jgi:transcriptional regulator with XRE-family HTH domain
MAGWIVPRELALRCDPDALPAAGADSAGTDGLFDPSTPDGANTEDVPSPTNEPSDEVRITLADAPSDELGITPAEEPSDALGLTPAEEPSDVIGPTPPTEASVSPDAGVAHEQTNTDRARQGRSSGRGVDQFRRPESAISSIDSNLQSRASGASVDGGFASPLAIASPAVIMEVRPVAVSRIWTAEGRGRIPVETSGALITIAAVPRIVPTAISAAVLGYAGTGWAGTLAFNVWLRRQLRERRMSQRHLAAKSGVNHSTISRLLRGERTPTLETATKLARAVTDVQKMQDVLSYFAEQSMATAIPTRRVEAALRGDGDLRDEDVRQLMDQYLRLRAERRQPTLPSSAAAIRPDRPKRVG